jgi:serine/threonine protein kinase
VDADPNDREPWLASAYVAGPSLQELVATTGPLATKDVLLITLGVARALAAIHAAGVVHRDLKPANIMLDESGPKVIDFGIVKSMVTSLAVHSTVTRIGTPPYMSPEQVMGRTVSGASDVFALGATLCFLATGRLAFDAENALAMAYRIANDHPALEGLDAAVAELARLCMAKDPAARPGPTQVAQACLDVLGPLEPGAYTRIAQATTAIRARTRALHEIAASSEPADKETRTDIRALGAVQGNSADATARMSAPTVRYGGTGTADEAQRARGARGDVRKVRWLAGTVAALTVSGCVLALALWLPGSGNHNSPSSLNSTTPAASSNSTPANPAPTSSSSSHGSGMIFLDNFNGSRKWTVGSQNDQWRRDHGQWDYTGGQLQLLPNAGYGLWPPAPISTAGMADVQITATARIMRGAGEIGVWCRGAGIDAPRYSFYLSTTQAVSIAIEGTSSGRTLVNYLAAPMVRSYADNIITAECRETGQGVELRLTVNGQLAATASDDASLASGSSVGADAVTWSSASPQMVDARFSAFQVEQLS